jgi:hypothetical protein
MAPAAPKTTRFPLASEEIADFTSATETYILPGYAPPEPFLPWNAAVATIGSCFAEHIGKSLTSMGIPASWIAVDENNNTPFVTDWCFSKIVAKADRNDPVVAPIVNASLIILTVGVALQKFLGDAPAPAGEHDYKGGEWRMFTVADLTGYLRSIIAKARQVAPRAHICITLSPIPLKGSPMHPSVFGQDCLSKSLMRVAIEQVLQDGVPNLTYWPSFEMIRWLGGHAGPFFGGPDAVDQRHVNQNILDKIMGLFIKRYYKQGS